MCPPASNAISEPSGETAGWLGALTPVVAMGVGLFPSAAAMPDLTMAPFRVNTSCEPLGVQLGFAFTPFVVTSTGLPPVDESTIWISPPGVTYASFVPSGDQTGSDPVRDPSCVPGHADMTQVLICVLWT